jgi:hypothetical protein
MPSKGHISSIGAGMFSDLSIALPLTDLTASQLTALDEQSEFELLFATEVASNGGTKATGTFVRVKDVREFPALGTPPNVVNVPVFGQSASQQIQGQSDSPSMEITVNYVATDWSSTSLLGIAMASKKQFPFRFSLLNADPGIGKYAAGSAKIGSVENTQFYWLGKIEAMVVNPQLTDANTATITITIQSKFFGAFTDATA